MLLFYERLLCSSGKLMDFGFTVMPLKVLWWDDCDLVLRHLTNPSTCVCVCVLLLKPSNSQPSVCCFHLLSLLSVSLLSGEGSSLSAPHLKRWRTSRRTLPSAGRTPSRAAAGVARLASNSRWIPLTQPLPLFHVSGAEPSPVHPGQRASRRSTS